MTDRDSVYDLGEIHLEERESRVREGFASPAPVYGRAPRASGPGPGLTGSLSLFLPGAGQIVAGETVWGLFFLSCVGFIASVAWALIETFERLLPTLDLLGVPRVSFVATFFALAASGCALHIGAASQAHALRDDGGPERAPHPALAGIASALIPGWGQILSGHRVRGALFLFAAWALGLCWLAVTPQVSAVLDACGFPVPPAVRDGWGPVALVALPLAVWAVGIYDAARR
jgi:TM2 domain-containing membrane protein YozV